MKFRRTFLRLFLPLAASILFGSYIYLHSQQESGLSKLEATERLNVGLGAGMLDRRFQVLTRDLRLLAGDRLLARYLQSSSASDRQEMEESFVNFSHARESYEQVRWIDAQGQEIVRIDRARDQSRASPPGTLQNKAGHYYFQAAMSLEPGGIYLSPLDFNAEQKQLELPPRPVLQIATPVADQAGRKRGVVVITYRFTDMIDPVRVVTQEVADHFSVVDGEGYFLYAPTSVDEWAGAFKKQELTLAARYPRSWERLLDSPSGQFQDDQGLWTHATVSPLDAGKGSASPRGGQHSSSDGRQRQWKVVTFLPADQLDPLITPDSPALYLLPLGLLLLSALGAYRLARLYGHEEEVETRFRIFFDQAMQGMALVLPDQRWQQANPALCGMLGYSVSELQERRWSDLTHPEDLPRCLEAEQRVLNGEANHYELEKRYLRADGAEVYTFTSVQAVRKPQGSVDYFLVVVEDITDRLNAQRALQASEERLRRLGDNLPESYLYQCVKRPGEPIEFIYVSSGVRLIHGVEPEELIRDSSLMFRYIDPAQIEDFTAAQQESINNLSDFTMELRIRRRNGDWGWMLVKSRPRQLPGGRIIWDGVASDITERREASILLDLQTRRAETLRKLPLQSTAVAEQEFMQYALAQIEQLTSSHHACLHLLGTAQDAVTQSIYQPGSPHPSLTYPLPLARAGVLATPVLTGQPLLANDPQHGATGCGALDTAPPCHRLVCVPVMDDGVAVMLAVVTNKTAAYTDTDVETVQLVANEIWRIVGRNRAEQALQIANQVVNNSPVVCFRWQNSPGWPVVFVSDNVANWGYSVEQLLAGQPLFSAIIHPDDQPLIADKLSRHLEEADDAYDQEYRLLTADRRTLWVNDRTRVVRNAAGEAIYFDGVLTDITERKRQEQELAANLSAQRLLNKRLEEAHNQLLQSEKMASIGQLAAGIAHELNNPIGFVHSNLGTLESYLRDVMDIIDGYASVSAESEETARASALARLERLKEERDFAYIREDIVALLAESKDGLTRVRKIVQDLKSFSHVSEQEWQWADLHQGLDSTLNIVWNELKYKCKVVKEYGELPKVHCLISQLNQVFMNLLVNAGHAIEDQGTITIRTSVLDQERICVEIGDTGKGIPPEHLSRIFEPFFTTKPVGKGTGLGLSLSYGIIDKHHGQIEVSSTVGVGTTFRVILPINPLLDASATPTEPSASDPTQEITS